MDIEYLLTQARKHLRLLDNYYVSKDERIRKVKLFLQEVVAFEWEHIEILDAELESVFTLLCEDIIRQIKIFNSNQSPSLRDAKRLLQLIVGTERYILDVEKLPWVVGSKVSFLEKRKLRSIFRRVLHNAYDVKQRRSVRGTKVLVKITGSLATGQSDWKLINGGNIPKPSDYDLPREFKRGLQRLDEELQIPYKLKPYMSDIDILIVNEVIYSSVDEAFKHTTWSFRLGEKYPVGVGASDIIKQLHQKLLGTKIGGIRGRWSNFVVLKDDTGYLRYLSERDKAVSSLSAKVGKKVIVRDIEIINEVIW